MKLKYDYEDLLLIVEKKATIEDMQKKYNVSRNAIIHALKYRRLKTRQKKILMWSPFTKPTLYKSISEASIKIGVSRGTITRGLKLGCENVKILRELEIHLKVVR